jgi:hypothetical protein
MESLLEIFVSRQQQHVSQQRGAPQGLAPPPSLTHSAGAGAWHEDDDQEVDSMMAALWQPFVGFVVGSYESVIEQVHSLLQHHPVSGVSATGSFQLLTGVKVEPH